MTDLVTFRLAATCAVLSLTASSPQGKAQTSTRTASRPAAKALWEKAILAFERQDRVTPPPQGAVLFVGSSTIRLWDTNTMFPDLDTINRGFGGSTYADVLLYADRIILPYKPKTIVLYAGDNDIAAGKSPEQVLADLKALIRKTRQTLPQTRIVILSIKLSNARWKLRDKMLKVNSMMQDLAKRDPKITYADLGKLLLDADGRPRPELFLKDGLHLNPSGYGIWAAALGPILPGE